MCGSRPLPEAVTRSTRHRRAGVLRLRRCGVRRRCGRSAWRWSGRGWSRWSRRRRSRRPPPRGGRGNSCSPVKPWPISSEPITLPSRSIRLPLAWRGKDGLGDAGHGQRIGEAGEDGQHDDHDEGGAELVQHVNIPSGEAEGGDRDVDQLDADERHDDAAEAVDRAGCGAAARRRRWPGTSRRAAPAGSAR